MGDKDSSNVLLSIKPEFAMAILAGKKEFEFRRTIFKNKNVRTAFVYASNPIGLVIGEFEIEQVIRAELSFLWHITKDGAGISEEYFNKYFKGKEVGYALRVGQAIQYKTPFSLTEMFNVKRPPQNFMYVGRPL